MSGVSFSFDFLDWGLGKRGVERVICIHFVSGAMIRLAGVWGLKKCHY